MEHHAHTEFASTTIGSDSPRTLNHERAAGNGSPFSVAGTVDLIPARGIRHLANINFCSACGDEIAWGVPSGDHTKRHYCATCGHIEYNNPIPLVLCLLHTKDRVLMIRRAIEPYTDSWAPPGGFVDQGESIDNAAVREFKEETGIDIDPDSLIPYYIVSIPDINQICFICRSEITEITEPQLGAEISEAQWFTKDEMPFDNYFLPNHLHGLAVFFDSLESGSFRVFMAEASYYDGFNRSVRPARR